MVTHHQMLNEIPIICLLSNRCLILDQRQRLDFMSSAFGIAGALTGPSNNGTVTGTLPGLGKRSVSECGCHLIAVVKPNLKTRIRLTDIVQDSGKGNVGNQDLGQSNGLSKSLGVSANTDAMIS
jgi:hypothetical protein